MTPWIVPFGNSGPAHHAAPIHHACIFSQAPTPKTVTRFSRAGNALSRTVMWQSGIREAGHLGGPLGFSGQRPKTGQIAPFWAAGSHSFQ